MYNNQEHHNNHAYKEGYAQLLSCYDFELFVTISLGIRYDPRMLEAKLRYALKHVTTTPYHCGFLGVYTEHPSPHAHLLLTSASEPLRLFIIEEVLRHAFKRKDAAPTFKRIDYSHENEHEVRRNVEREHSTSVDARLITNQQGVIRYLCQQYPNMPQHSYNEIFGNLKALEKRRRTMPTLWDDDHEEVIAAIGF